LQVERSRTCAETWWSVNLLIGVGCAVGFRIRHGVSPFLLAPILALGFAFAMSCIFCLIGLAAANSETAQLIAFPVLFPLGFVSSAFVPVSSMPGWLQTFCCPSTGHLRRRCRPPLTLGLPAATKVVASLA
jgi:ABC-2 type transport system permease protein/oleandomycin transport system permease protein